MSTTTTAVKLTPGAVLGKEAEQTEWPENAEDVLIPLFDTGVFINELAKLHALPGVANVEIRDPKKLLDAPENLIGKAQEDAPDSLREGTWRGTQLALTKAYELLESSVGSYMDTANFEPTVPTNLDMNQKRQVFVFTDGTDGYPPHLDLKKNEPAAKVEPSNVQKSTLPLTSIFSALRLAQLGTILPKLVPHLFLDLGAVGAGAVNAAYGGMGTPDAGKTIADVEKYNKKQREKWILKDIFNLPNVGDLKDWYTDVRFAQQHFTGTNPTTIEPAAKKVPGTSSNTTWIDHFIGASKDPADKSVQETIKSLSKDSLYVQDYSYFRAAAGIQDPAAVIKKEFEETYKDQGKAKTRKGFRHTVASVCLFHLNDAGVLIPLAIIIDWRGSAEKSLTIYNRELLKRGTFFKAESGAPKAVDEANDWPWRYAKTCVQSSDWLRHEVTVHLTDTHLVEEAIIVAANRQLRPDHPVLRLLYPHWQKTLSLNAAARLTLVPFVILDLIGFKTEEAQNFIKHAYDDFNFTEQYVPNDLKRRGFPPEKLNEKKYHNYTYARCIDSMWHKIRTYVEDMLKIKYKSSDRDAEVKNDAEVQAWSEEMRNPQGARLKSFPTLSTFNDLVDCVTMCIHIASPQHTAVNYLQNYYQSFVINKPSALYSEPPDTLEKLYAFKEDDLVQALPMNHPQDWLLASHIPYLLSFKPGEKESLIIYAASKYHVYKAKTQPDEVKTKEAAALFYSALAKSKKEFQGYAAAADESDVLMYEVLNPDWNAVSILI